MYTGDTGLACRNIVEQIRTWLISEGIAYPSSQDIAKDLVEGRTGTTLSSFFAELKQESSIQQEQSMIEQGIQEALRKLGITGTTQTASLMPDEIFGVPIIYLVGVVGAAYLVSRR